MLKNKSSTIACEFRLRKQIPICSEFERQTVKLQVIVQLNLTVDFANPTQYFSAKSPMPGILSSIPRRLSANQ